MLIGYQLAAQMAGFGDASAEWSMVFGLVGALVVGLITFWTLRERESKPSDCADYELGLAFGPSRPHNLILSDRDPRGSASAFRRRRAFQQIQEELPLINAERA